MKKLKLTLFVVLVAIGNLPAQNLVSNGDFSSKSGTGCSIKNFTTPPSNWAKAPTGYSHTPDFYHTCAGAGNSNYPGSNWNGCADPQSGTGYIGIKVHPTNSSSYGDVHFEYVYQQITTLNQGTSYYIEFYVRPADDNGNNAAVKTLGMYLTDNAGLNNMGTGRVYGLNHITPQIKNTSQFYDDVTGWTKISGTYIPSSSGVKNIVIGNFDPDVNNGQGSVQVLPGHTGTSQQSYYYIDAVYIAPAIYGVPDYDAEISGPGEICSSNATFTLSNYNSLANVTWQATPSSLFYSSSGTGAIATLKAKNSLVNGSGTLTYTIQGSCDASTKSETVWVGKPQVTTRPSGVPAIQASVGDWIVIRATTPGASLSSLNWWTNNSNALDLNVGYGNCSVECLQLGYNFVYVTSSNSCGTSLYRQIPINVSSGGGGGGGMRSSASYSPNPVSDVLNVDLYSKDETGQTKRFEVTFIDKQNNVLFNAATDKEQISIDVSHLTKGVYFLTISCDEWKDQVQIIKN